MPTLHWIGKDKVTYHNLEVPYKVLEHGYGFTAEKGQGKQPTGSGNLIIQGDNLEALKNSAPAQGLMRKNKPCAYSLAKGGAAKRPIDLKAAPPPAA